MMTPAVKPQRSTRDRLLPMKVFVTEGERAVIESRAAAANLSVSAHLRTAGLNKTTRSSSSAYSRDTWLLLTPDMPNACTRSSTARVETPWM